MEGLYRAKSDGSQEKAMATSEKVSKDGKTYTFTLRKDNKWSNGDPVTAQDFVYSWRRTVDPKTASQYAYLFEGIKNATDIQNGKKKPETLGIKAVGKYKLVVTLDRRIPYFNNLMAFGSFFPQNEKAVKKYGSKYGTASKYMVYNGPYIMQRLERVKPVLEAQEEPILLGQEECQAGRGQLQRAKDPVNCLQPLPVKQA